MMHQLFLKSEKRVKRFSAFYFLTSLLFVTSLAFAEAPVVDANQEPNTPSEEESGPPAQGEQQYVPAESQEKANLADLLSKIEALTTEVQSLRGQLETVQHDVKVLTDQQRANYKDLDDRIGQLKGNNESSKQDTPKVASNTGEHKEVLSRTFTKEAPKEKSNDAKEEKKEGLAAYKAAYKLLQNKQYDKAINQLENFIVTYPKSSQRANAHYWLGEVYLIQGQMQQAEQQFKLVMNEFQTSAKAPAAHLKLGLIAYDKGQWQEAREQLNKVKQKYPDTNIAQLASAKLEEMDRQGL